MHRAMMWREQFAAVVKLNVAMSEPREDDDGKTDKEVDVAVPDDAGRIVEVGSE